MDQTKLVLLFTHVILINLVDEKTIEKLKEMEEMLKTNSMIMADYEKSY